MNIAIPTLGLLLILGGCGPAPGGDNATTPAPAPAASPTDSYLEQINGLTPGQRNAVLYRALDDAGMECQGVASSEPRAPIGGRPAWTAHCAVGSNDKGRDFTVVLQPGGVMQVGGAGEPVTPAPTPSPAP